MVRYGLRPSEIVSIRLYSMAFLGLVPSECSSGHSRLQGGITKRVTPTPAASSSSRLGAITSQRGLARIPPAPVDTKGPYQNL
jgi:transposase